jgi:transcription elongation factor, greA/greB, C-term
MEKTIIAKQVLEKLKTDLMRTIKQRDEAQQEANSHVGAMESRYDTFKEEAQYLVSGCNKQIEKLNKDIDILTSFIMNSPALKKKMETVEAGTLITVIKNNMEEYFLLLPVGGGSEIITDKKTIRIITLLTPLAKALLHKGCETITLSVDDDSHTITIINIE